MTQKKPSRRADKNEFTRLLKACGLRQEVIASRIGLSEYTWFQRRQRIGKLTLEEMGRLAKVLHVSPTFLLEMLMKELPPPEEIPQGEAGA